MKRRKEMTTMNTWIRMGKVETTVTGLQDICLQRGKVKENWKPTKIASKKSYYTLGYCKYAALMTPFNTYLISGLNSQRRRRTMEEVGEEGEEDTDFEELDVLQNSE